VALQQTGATLFVALLPKEPGQVRPQSQSLAFSRATTLNRQCKCNLKENHAILLREMRAEFDRHGFLLTAAVSAGFKTIDKEKISYNSCSSLTFRTYRLKAFFVGLKCFSPFLALSSVLD
jgi:hypothetical protein